MRLSAVYMAAFTLYVLVFWSLSERFVFTAWHAWFSLGVVRVGWALFIGMMLAHGWFGIHSVYMDYVKPAWIRMVVSALTALAFLAMAVWAVVILLGVQS